MMSETEKNTKSMIGIVVSNKMDKTIVVEIQRQIKHPSYKKYIKRRAKYLAHDENQVCKIGDTVKISETRPLSKRKNWKLDEIISK
jgi:small subunit ribosomal protein S17